MPHGGSTNQPKNLLQTHFGVIRSIIKCAPPIQLSPPQNRVFEPLTVVNEPTIRPNQYLDELHTTLEP